MKNLRERLVENATSDPVLSISEMRADAGVSLSTFRRSWLPDLPMIQLSERRRGCLRSAYERLKTSRMGGRAA